MSLRLKNWFFTSTATATQRGTRYKNGDRPPESTFADHIESSIFKTEANDRAKEDEGSFNALNNGHVTLATGAQAKAYEAQKTDRSLVVAPENLTEVSQGEADTIDDFEGETVEVSVDPTKEKRSNFLLRFTDGFKNWLANFKQDTEDFIKSATPRLLPEGGDTGQALVKASDSDYDAEWSPVTDTFLENLSYQVTESLENDVDIVTVIDNTGAMGPYVSVIADQMQLWYDNFKQANPWYQGNFYVHNGDSLERWVRWPQLYGSNLGRTKVMMVAFIDESNTRYTSSDIGTIATAGPTSTYQDDFNTFVSTVYPSFSFFKGIVYAVPSSNTAGLSINERAMFHSHIYQAVHLGTVPAGTYVESPLVVAAGSTLAFIETTNNYSNVTGSLSQNGRYDGLSEYGWTEYHDFGTDDINTKLTAEEFDNRIQDALFGPERQNTVTVEITADMKDSTEIVASHDINIPVAQIPFDQYKDLPNPTSSGEVNALADGTLYYLTAAQIWGAGSAPGFIQDTDKLVFVVNS